MKHRNLKYTFRQFISIVLVFALILTSAIVGLAVEKPKTFSIPPSKLQLDENGDNILGNIHEQFAMGGFYASQNNWLFYADWKRNGALTMTNADGSVKHELTDFPVGNINVAGDVLSFTDLSATVLRHYRADSERANSKVFYGGLLYEAKGVKALMTGGKLSDFTIQQIGGNDSYYLLISAVNGIFALSGSEKGDKIGTDWKYVGLRDGKVLPFVAAGENEKIVNMLQDGSIMYFEVDKGNEWGSIDRFDGSTGEMLDSISGREVSLYGDKVFFISNTNHYLYDMWGGDGGAIAISNCPVSSYSLQENGDIKALGANGYTEILISKYGEYQGYEKVYKVGEWYNYYKTTYPKKALTSSNGYSWIIENDFVDTVVEEPQSKPQENDGVSPEVATQMVMTMIKGGTIDDEIFSKYYNAEEKAAFQEYYNSSFKGKYDASGIEKYAVEYMQEEFLTSEHIEKMQSIFKNYMNTIEFSLSTNSTNETDATVTMNLTKTISDDIDSLMSETSLEEHIMEYIFTKGLSFEVFMEMQSEEDAQVFLIDAVIDFMEKVLVPIDVNKQIELNLVADEALGWVIVNPSAMDTIIGNESNANVEETDEAENTITELVRTSGMEYVFEKVNFDSKVLNFWQSTSRGFTRWWNEFFGIETKRYELNETGLKGELVLGAPLPGRELCPDNLRELVPNKSENLWETIKGLFS